MSILNLSSQITFLYFKEIDNAKKFFDEILQLEMVCDQGWAYVWKTGKESFVGAVDSSKGSIKTENRGGVLISLTVTNIEEVYESFKKLNLDSCTEIKEMKDIGLKSFFFKGPEGYDFEIQQFTVDEFKEIF